MTETDHPNAPVLLIERKGAVDWLTLNRPRKHNALDPTLIDALCDYFAAVADDDDVRVIVLRGSGPSFCAGLDLRAQLTGADTRRIIDLMPLIRACPQPVVSLVHGAAKGGGFVMALACDVRVAGESARMDDTFIDIGLSGCDVGISWFLPRMVGLSVASELMLTGRTVDAHRAERLGLVSEVVTDSDLDAAGQRVADGLLSKSPLGLRRTKEMLNRALALDDLAEVIRMELDIQVEVMRSDPAFNARLDSYGDKK
ncbi:enoyl-CoA hydratase/isomerase family protein [Actinospongicola halichondriae]|uniref:enoyl-CoA hydratase/isomerase family protein n=1 Tax=Actinospongicola halichondriae TaxID=3236844 RepID=UPI003D487415